MTILIDTLTNLNIHYYNIFYIFITIIIYEIYNSSSVEYSVVLIILLYSIIYMYYMKDYTTKNEIEKNNITYNSEYENYEDFIKDIKIKISENSNEIINNMNNTNNVLFSEYEFNNIRSEHISFNFLYKLNLMDDMVYLQFLMSENLLNYLTIFVTIEMFFNIYYRNMKELMKSDMSELRIDVTTKCNYLRDLLNDILNILNDNYSYNESDYQLDRKTKLSKFTIKIDKILLNKLSILKMNIN